MSCHQKAHRVVDELNLPGEPIADQFHTYHVHKNGDILRETPHDRDMWVRKHRALNEPDPKDELCDQDRLTLIHLPRNKIVRLETPQEDQRPRVPWPNSVDIPSMPPEFIEAMKNICTHCDCKRDILWRNFHRADSHFEACFRYHDDGEAYPSQKAPLNKCFLKLYTLRVPYIAKKPLILSMVHHIRVEGNKFVSARSGTSTNKEHMFCLVAGFEVFDVTQILTRLVPRWSDIPADHLQPTAGLTPKLFLATVISQYGFLTSRDIVKSCSSLAEYDDKLKLALEDLQTLPPDSFSQIQDDTDIIRQLNTDLIDMNRNLTGTKSVMHYLASSAGILIDRISGFETYVATRISEWDDNSDKKALKKFLLKLDSSQEKLRDRDKLQIVQKSMHQHMVDIDALHEHIDINISMVHNLIAEKDRAIQCLMAIKSNKDGFNMKIIAILTAFFLPGTFMAVLLTTPMFRWDRQPGDPLILKLPFKIYWATSISMTVFFAIGLVLISYPRLVKYLVDRIHPKEVRVLFQNTEFYRSASERVDRKRAVKKEKKDSIERRQSRHEGKNGEAKQTVAQLGTSNGLPRVVFNGDSISAMEEGRASKITV